MKSDALKKVMGSRWWMALFSMGIVFFFGAGYGYSAMRIEDQRMILIAYANGYKDAMEYVFKSNKQDIDRLKNDSDQFKAHVLYAADSYVEKVLRLN